MGPGARQIGVVLALGGLLVVLDTTVTIVAIPAILAGLHTTLATVQWTTTGYLLGVVAVIPVAGWAANRFGDRRVYMVALGTFTVSSALAGLAWDPGSLIAFRVLQGIGGGLLNPVGMAIGLRAVPRQKRGAMMSLLGLPVIVGPLLGPPLAGWLVDIASWRWIFGINVPIGLVAMLACQLALPPSDRSRRATPTPVDWLGLVQITAGGVLLVLGCTLFGKAGAPTVGPVSAGLAGVGLLTTFVVRTLHTARPLLHLRLLRHRALAAGTAVLAFFGAAYFGSMTIVPMYVQAVRGDAATVAGALAIPMALAVGLTLQVATRLVDKVAPHKIVIAGTSLGLLGAICLLLATTGDASYTLIASAAAILGVGSGATLMPTMTIAVRDLEGADIPRGTTLLALTQQLSAALGTALIAAALTLEVRTQVPQLNPAGNDVFATMLSLNESTRDTLRTDLTTAVGSAYILTAILLACAVTCATTGIRPRIRHSDTHAPERRRQLRAHNPKR